MVGVFDSVAIYFFLSSIRVMIKYLVIILWKQMDISIPPMEYFANKDSFLTNKSDNLLTQMDYSARMGNKP